MNRLSACFLLSRFEMGGLERVQMHIAAGLVKAGKPTEIVARYVSDQAQALLKPDVPTRTLAGNSLVFMCRLVRWLRHAKPETIFTSANDIGCLVILLRLFFWRKSNIIWTQHLSISGPLLASKGLQRVRLLFEIWLMRRLVKHADAVVAVSKSVAEDMKCLLLLDLSIAVINNPVVSVDFDARSREEIKWPWANKEIPTVVFVGRLAPVKRIDLLLRAFALCLRARPMRLLIVGDGLEAEAAKQLATELNLGWSCVFVGNRDNPLPWIRSADLLVLCSDYEGFGLVLVEAMACGTQVVATDCPYGPAEVMDGGRYGYLVPMGNVDALAAAIESSLEHPRVTDVDLRARAADYSVEGAVMQYVNLLNSLKK